MAKKILVIDDEPDIARTIEVMLKAVGYDVVTASDGEEGYHKASTEHPDLIITDLLLPKIDGWRVCQRLKNDELLKRIPVIMMSALLQEESGIDALEIGDAYMTKPLKSKELFAKVRELLEKSP